MRVLHVIPAVAARYGGPSVVAVATAQALQQCGHDVAIATTDADGDGRLAVSLGEAVVWEGVPTYFFSRSASEAYKWSPSLAAWLDAHVAEFDVVDVHAVFSHSSVAAGRACQNANIPYVVRPHGALDPWSLGRKSWQKKAVLLAGARRMLSGAARIQYTTPAEHRLAMQVFPWLPAGVVVPLGVDDICFVEARQAASPPYVLAMSRLEPKKELELLIEAFHVAAANNASWRLVIAGDGLPAYVGALHDAAVRGAASERITFTGWVEGIDKRRLIAGSSVFASPSAQENFGLSVMEAMAAGVPALVSPGVNLADEIQAASAGWVVERQTTALAARLTRIFDDALERERRGLAARRLAERYRWTRSVEALQDVYRAVAPRGVAAHA